MRGCEHSRISVGLSGSHGQPLIDRVNSVRGASSVPFAFLAAPLVAQQLDFSTLTFRAQQPRFALGAARFPPQQQRPATRAAGEHWQADPCAELALDENPSMGTPMFIVK
jgi:hypothetical protein